MKHHQDSTPVFIEQLHSYMTNCSCPTASPPEAQPSLSFLTLQNPSAAGQRLGYEQAHL